MSSEPDFAVRNEYAVRCSIVSKSAHILEYIKAISSLVGASHILAVFEETDSIKVFLDDKRHVDTLLTSCLHVRRRHIKVDYVIPPGIRLILSNVDPIITNFDITSLLEVYGSVVSPIIQPPISDDVELCHISYGVRYVYMLLNGCIPEKLEFKYGDQFSHIKVCVVENSDSHMLQHIKTDNLDYRDEVECHSPVYSVPGPSIIDTFSHQEPDDSVFVSVQSVPDINSKEQVESVCYQTSGINATSSKLSLIENTEQVIIMKRKRGRPSVKERKKVMTATCRAAKKIKRRAKRKCIRRPYKKTNCKRQYIRKSSYLKSSFSSSTPISVLPGLSKGNDSYIPNESANVLDNEQLEKYLDEVKSHRAPLELARKYIGEDCDSHKISKLIFQLKDYRGNQEDLNLRSRINRLIRSIRDSLSVEAKPD